jgi:predicted DNA-binding protein YlxM (UPF0122 family)
MPQILTKSQVVEVRQLYLTGQVSMSELARAFMLSKAAIQCVLDCRNWPYLLAQGEREALAQMRMKRRPYNGNGN